MPYKKKKKARPGRPKANLDIGLDEDFPVEVINMLLSIPPPNYDDDDDGSSNYDGVSNDGDDTSEPAAKRRKTATCCYNHKDLSPMSVAKGNLCISRRCDECISVPFSKTFASADTALDLSIRPSGDALVIKSRPSCLKPALLATVLLKPSEGCKNARGILEIKRCPRQRLDAAIWSSVDMVIERRRRTVSFKFTLELFWNVTSCPHLPLRTTTNRKISQKVIDNFFPTARDRGVRSPKVFFDAVFVPPKDDKASQSIEIAGLAPTLFPFQKRTLQWLLWREGCKWADGRLVELTDEEWKRQADQVDTFRAVKDTSGKQVFVSDVLQVVTRDTGPYRQAIRCIRGGLLAEEMGLGKTVEVLSLILLHRNSRLRKPAHSRLTPSKATLIVTPTCLTHQWLSEISRHAPSLRVLNYKGCKQDEWSSSQEYTDDQGRDIAQEEDEEGVLKQLAECDIVLTTYSVLSAELHFTMNAPERSRRFERAYLRTMSPLVKIYWWRVCLDEAQMMEEGVRDKSEEWLTYASMVVEKIHRVNSWAMSGTPLKNNVKDLWGIWVILDFLPYKTERQVWEALLLQHKTEFEQLIGSTSLRHTKVQVRDEMELPPQKRYTITMPFTAVEEQHYQSLFQQMASECNLSLDGVPLVEGWNAKDYEEKMRRWLDRLRKAALHPEARPSGRRVGGSRAARPVRTLEEVLDGMIEESEAALRNDKRSYMSYRLTHGQLYENGPETHKALDIWTRVRADAEELVASSRARLKQVVEVKGSRDDKAAVQMHDHDSEGTGEYKRRLRSDLELYHKAVFFCANAYFQLRENVGRERAEAEKLGQWIEAESEEYQGLKKLEDEGYEQAKKTRREILETSYGKVKRAMDVLAQKASQQKFVEIPRLVVGGQKRPESADIMNELAKLYQELDEQAKVIEQWREQMVELLLRPLMDEDEEGETTGEELADSAKVQDLAMVYHQALRGAVADRQDATSGQGNQLVKYETDTALGLASRGQGPAPDKMLEILRQRICVQPRAARRGVPSMSIRKAIGELGAVQTRLGWQAAGKSEAIVHQMSETQTQLWAHNRATQALEAEVEGFKAVMNVRVDYYRQLQAVSDAVLPYEGPKTQEVADDLAAKERALRDSMAGAAAKHRYLLNLKDAGAQSSEAPSCVICQMPFATGVMTACGHEFCKECIKMWLKSHSNCPVCKVGLTRSNLHNMTVQPRRQLQMRRDDDDDDDAPKTPQRQRKSKRLATSTCSDFDAAHHLREMQQVELHGPSFSTKVDTLVRHVLWLRRTDPGAKALVFSHYTSLLHMVGTALAFFGIAYAAIDDPQGVQRFHADAATSVFLLHARAHSAGLSLVCASHVVLCEPLLNTPLQLQAIARVHRIGQRFPTTVWLLLVAGSVEENIHHLAARRRLQYLGKSSGGRRGRRGDSETMGGPQQDALLDAANSMQMQRAPLSRLMSRDDEAGELVYAKDLWPCLFGHVARRPAARDD